MPESIFLIKHRPQRSKPNRVKGEGERREERESQ